MAIEIVDFPINSMVIFHGKMLVHQRVYGGSKPSKPPIRYMGVSENVVYP